MTTPSPELQQLVGAYLAGSANPPEVARLSELLRNDPAARAYYLETADVHAALATDETIWANREAITNQVLPLPPSETGFPRQRWKFAALIGALAACIAMIVWWGVNHFKQPARPAVENPVRPSPALAVLSRAVDSEWSGGSSNLIEGAELSAGILTLARGTIQVDFYSGARLVIVGPAELEIRSAREVHLQRGKITCEVNEQGRGFRISAPGMQVVDLGTLFGLKVPDNGKPEVHVLEGKVAVAPTGGGDFADLTQSQAVRLTDGVMAATKFTPEEFPRSKELRQREDAEADRRFAAWREFSAELDRDPVVLSHFTFDGDEADAGGSVQNLAQSPARGSDGMIIGARRTDGRWPGKRALEFRGRGDRVLLGVPGRHESFTFAVWVRVDAYQQQVTALLVTEESYRWRGLENAGVPVSVPESSFRPLRWELRSDGQLALNWERTQPVNGKYWHIHWADTELKPDRLGAWTLLATVVDQPRREVVHYVNGQVVARWPAELESPFTLTRLCLGNLSSTQSEAKLGIRYDFFGRMDEVLIAGRPFSEPEIAQLYEMGKP